jgi:hypothetical protein
MMGHDAQKKWFDIVTTYATNQSQQELENCIERFLLPTYEKMKIRILRTTSPTVLRNTVTFTGSAITPPHNAK